MTTPSPKPVKAWAVVGNDSTVFPGNCYETSRMAEKDADTLNEKSGRFYRVIPVLITPIGENDD